jgi:hypothetical protein
VSRIRRSVGMDGAADRGRGCRLPARTALLTLTRPSMNPAGCSSFEVFTTLNRAIDEAKDGATSCGFADRV